MNSLFKELKPKWIHVPSRRVPYNRRGRGGKFRKPFNKGIAFVKFSNEETQKQAVAEFNGKEVNGREIIVDIAIDSRIQKKGQLKKMLMMKKMLKQIAMVTKTIKLNKNL